MEPIIVSFYSMSPARENEDEAYFKFTIILIKLKFW